MLDKILYLLFRKNTGLTLLALLVTTVALTLSGCTIDCGCLRCVCDGVCSGGTEPGCICEAIGDCNQKCDQSCAACHACNTCMWDCSDNCENGCQDSCDNACNGCKEATYEYSMTIEAEIVDVNGNRFSEYYAYYYDIWEETLTRKQAEKRDTVYNIPFSQTEIDQLFHGLPGEYKVAGLYKIDKVVCEEPNSVSYSNGTLIVNVPKWTDPHEEYYRLHAKFVLVEKDDGCPVEFRISYSQNITGASTKSYPARLGGALPQIEVKNFKGFEYASSFKYESADGSTYLFDPTKTLRLYDFLDYFQKTDDSSEYKYRINITLSYERKKYTLTCVKYENGKEVTTRTFGMEGGSYLEYKLRSGVIDSPYASDFKTNDKYYSAVWTHDRAGEIPFDIEGQTVISKDVTLYFHTYTKITVTLNNTDPESGGTETLTFGYGFYIGGPDHPIADLPDTENYAFDGWYFDEHFTKEFCADEYTEPFKLFAKWKRVTVFNINYYLSPEDYSNKYVYSTDSYNIYNDKYLSARVPLPTQADEHFEFAGWQVVGAQDPSPIKKISSGEYRTDIDLIAAFSHKLVLILDNGRGESIGSSSTSYAPLYRQKYSLPIPKNTDENLVFKGWKSGSVLVTDDRGRIGEFLPDSGWQEIGDTFYLTAVWETTITFVWEEKGETQRTEQTVTYGDTVKAPSIDTTGYDFLGWFDSDGNSFDETATVTKKTEYRAKLEPKTYTITLVYKTPDGDERKIKEVTIKYGEAIDLGTYEVDGKTFYYWEDAEEKQWTDDSGKMTKKYDLTEDVTLYAFMF